MPPILNHGDTNYGKIEDCKKGVGQEKMVMASVAPVYKKSNLTWTKIYNLNTKIASEEPLKADIRSLHFLPLHCKLWKEMGEDEAKFAKYLKDFIEKTDPKGSYTIGSGYNTGAPRLEFNELFEGLSSNLQQAVSDAQDSIAKMSKAEKGEYACVHLRSRDIFLTQEMEDKPLKDWVKQNLVNVGHKPLLVISANLQKNVRDTMRDVCSKEETECIDGKAVLNSKSMQMNSYGFPDGDRLKSNKQLLIELATCAMASDVYLPNSQKKILNGQELKAEHEHLFKSTFSDLIATMAKSDKMKGTMKNFIKAATQVKLAKKAGAKLLQSKKVTKSKLAMVYVANAQKDNCNCMATQLNESPYQVNRVQAVIPATMRAACYPKKGTKNADKVLRAQKCTQYNIYKLAYENSVIHNTTYSLIFEDNAIIKREGFWEQVDKYLSSPCQEWDFTAVDISKSGEPITAGSLNKDLKMCSWGESSQEAIYPKVGAGTHLQIIRNTAIPRMLQYMDEEEKRDLPMDSLVNHFGKVVGWYPELAARNGKHLLKMAWKHTESGSSLRACASKDATPDQTSAASDPMAFECPQQQI